MEDLLARALADEDPLGVDDHLLASEALGALLVHAWSQDRRLSIQPDFLVLRDVSRVWVQDLLITDLVWRGRVILSSRISGHSEEAFAFCSAAVTLSESCFEEVKLVIKSQLFVFLDVLLGKDADTYLVLDGPLASLTIWIATMVDEPCNVSWVSRVDDLVVLNPHQVSTFGVLVSLDSLRSDFRVGAEHLTNILHHERILGDKFSSCEPPSFELSFNWIDQSILKKLEMPICTVNHGWTRKGATLNMELTVNASGSTV